MFVAILDHATDTERENESEGRELLDHIQAQENTLAVLEVRFTVPGTPVPKGRPRVYHGRAVTPPRTVAYEEAVGYAALQARPWYAPTKEPVSVVAWFYMANKHRVDIDNLQKALADGLTGVLIEDDAQIIHFEAVKMVDREYPRAEIVVRMMKGGDNNASRAGIKVKGDR